MKIFCNLLKQRLGKALVLLGFAVVATQSYAWVMVTTSDKVLFTDQNVQTPWYSMPTSGSWGVPAQVSASSVATGVAVMVNTAGIPFIKHSSYDYWVQLNLPRGEASFKKIVISADGKFMYGLTSDASLYGADISNLASSGYLAVWNSAIRPIKDVTITANYAYAVSTQGSIYAAARSNYAGFNRIPAGGYLTSISSGKQYLSGVELIWGIGGDGNIWYKTENPADSWYQLPGGGDVRTGNWVDVSPDPTGYQLWARDRWNGLFMINYNNWPNVSSTWQNARVTSVSGFRR